MSSLVRTAAFLALFLLFASPGAQAGEPAFNGYDWTGGKSLTPEQMRGNVVVLLFCADWAGPSVWQLTNEVPNLVAFFKDKPVRVIAVFDEKGATRRREIVNANKIQIPTCVDFAGQTFARFQLNTVPSYAVLDKEGNIFAHGLASVDEAGTLVMRALDVWSDEQPGVKTLARNREPLDPVEPSKKLREYRALMAYESRAAQRRSDHEIAIRVSEAYRKASPAQQKALITTMGPAIRSELAAARSRATMSLNLGLGLRTGAVGGASRTGVNARRVMMFGDYAILLVGSEHLDLFTLKSVASPGGKVTRHARLILTGTVSPSVAEKVVSTKSGSKRTLSLHLNQADYQIIDKLPAGAGFDIQGDQKVRRWTTVGTKSVPNSR